MAVESVVRFRDVNIAAGTSHRGLVTVGETPMGPVEFPFVFIRGVDSGPTLCVTAGVHATEYPAIDAVLRTIVALDPRSLSGSVLAVPVVNSAMFRTRSGFVSPIDGLNLNRTFPGRADGTTSEVLAHVVLNEFVATADFHIDCHGGDLTEVLWPYVGCPLTGDAERDQRAEAMARLYSPQIIALYREDSRLPATNGSLVKEASRLGIPSIITESGSAGGLDPAHVEIHMNGIRNVMQFLKMIPGDPVISGPRVVATDQFLVDARRGGLLRLAIGIGDEIRTGQVIAEICNVFGDVVEKVTAPRDGIARIVWTAKAVNTGDPIVKCWVTAPAPPFPATDRFAGSHTGR